MAAKEVGSLVGKKVSIVRVTKIVAARWNHLNQFTW